MRKLRVLSIQILLLSTIAFVVFFAYTHVIKDTQAPKITFENDRLEVSVKDPETALFADVKADDNRMGDITDSVVIEKMSSLTDQHERTITYAVMDDSMNVGRATRIVTYKDYTVPAFKMTGPLCFVVGQTPNVLSKMQAESSLDGDLSDHIKYSMERGVDVTKAGEYPVTFRVVDSTGQMVTLDTTVELVERLMLLQEIELTDYLIYHKKGQSFNPMKYVKSGNYEGTIQVDSKVKKDEPGTYCVDYFLVNEQGIISGKSRLVVVVK